MDASIAHIRLLHSLRTHLDEKLTELSRKHNTLIHINKLPEELSATILLHAAPRGEADIGGLQKLASVQTLWWHIIMDHAVFWTDLHADSAIDLVELNLRRSRDAPLTIDCSTSQMDDEAVEEFMEILEPHRHRWKSFTYTGHHLHLVDSYFEGALPNLEHLHFSPDIVYDDNGEPSPPPWIDFSGGPKLRRLFVSAADIPLDRLSNLTSLTIKEVPDYILLPGSLYTLLASSPHLQELDLSEIYAVEGRDFDVPNPNALSQVALRSFLVDSTSDALIAFVLQTIPITGDLDLSFASRVRAGLVLDHLLQPLGDGSPVLQTLLYRSTAVPVEVRFLAGDHLHITQDGSPGLWLFFDHLPWPSALQKLRSLSLDGIPVHLTYGRNDHHVLDQSVDMIFFRPWPNVVSFTFRCTDSDAHQIIHYLSHPQETEGGTVKWLWSSLSRLYLSHEFESYRKKELWPSARKALHALVEARNSNLETAVCCIVTH